MEIIPITWRESVEFCVIVITEYRVWNRLKRKKCKLQWVFDKAVQYNANDGICKYYGYVFILSLLN